ncbi:UNVERIFIED_CONTAM: hypothetical protein PYX00_005949 [Menopon gallinae]|uniref:Uncharacterized protein n=1 Tax=Menopon gallinae TaxID=328185 RepID=A0AAW2HVF0_9NEOP
MGIRVYGFLKRIKFWLIVILRSNFYCFSFQYTEDVEKLNEAASQRPHSVLVQGLKRESQHMRELRAENRELRIALAEYQNSVKLIMSKYRQQISQLVKASKIEISSLHSTHCSHYSQVILDQYSKMEKMRRVMKEALNLIEDNTSDKELKVEELITRLMTENKGLRELINIYTKYGCQQPIDESKEEEQKPQEEPQQQQEQQEQKQEEQQQQQQQEEEQKPQPEEPAPEKEEVCEKKEEAEEEEKKETPSDNNQ